ncbi:MAG TPA: hypothetical protein VHV27_01620 [Phenylobacterium sp.]|jgi:hypothetical protein|nr:hypothetical protein [Phenylobacterium sp.]
MRRGFALAGPIAAATLLGACAALPRIPPPAAAKVAGPPPAAPAPRVVRLHAPKPVRCVPQDLGPPPAYPDSEAALRDADGAADRYQLLAAGRILRAERLAKLEEVVRRCRKASR